LSLPTLTLYSRSYCHLCDDMLAALSALRTELAFELLVVDIDSEAGPALLARFDELVPVLLGSDIAAPPLCHYFFDRAAVQAYLLAAPA